MEAAIGSRHEWGHAIWRVADPKFTLASVGSLLIGASVAGRQGPISWPWLGVTVLGIFCVEAAKNASGEVFDWDSGTDPGIRDDERTPFSGGKRVIVDGLLSRGETVIVALVFYVLAGAAGLAIVALREPRVLWLGIAGIALAYFYHAPPIKLAYRGLGELAVGITYGPVIACGTYLVQHHSVSRDVLLVSLPYVFAQMSSISLCEFPDARSDEAAGKRTWVVRLGRQRAAGVYPWLIPITYGPIALLPLVGLPLGVWGGFAGLPCAIIAARRLRASVESPAALIPAFPWALANFMLVAVGMSLGILYGR